MAISIAKCIDKVSINGKNASAYALNKRLVLGTLADALDVFE